jgi:hypothetical protein
MNEFTIVTLIGRRVDEVFADVEDVAKTPVWTPRLSEVCRTSDDRLAPSATIVYTGTASTRVTSTYRGESRSFFKLAEPLVVRLTRRQFEAPPKTGERSLKITRSHRKAHERIIVAASRSLEPRAALLGRGALFALRNELPGRGGTVAISCPLG